MKQAVRVAIGFAAVALSCLTSSGALAGIVDTPLPTLVAGKKTLHVYSVSGVNGGGGGQFGTYFSCTSTDSATIQVGVEIFCGGGGAPANDAAADSLSVGPGQTVLFGTLSGAGFILNSSPQQNLWVRSGSGSAPRV